MTMTAKTPQAQTTNIPNIKTAVFGAFGRMGTAVCHACNVDTEVDLVAKVGRDHNKDDIAAAESSDVVVDFTTPSSVKANVLWALERGIHAVVGTSGLTESDIDDIAKAATTSNCLVAPNFSLGAVLATRFAAQVAHHFPSCEIVELHHNEKLDAPSGTSIRAAKAIEEAWQAQGRPQGGLPHPDAREVIDGARGAAGAGTDASSVRIHSVRLKGLVAHQEIIFGGTGEILTIRHDSIDRTSFMDGVLLAIKKIANTPGVTVGLDSLLV